MPRGSGLAGPTYMSGQRGQARHICRARPPLHYNETVVALRPSSCLGPPSLLAGARARGVAAASTIENSPCWLGN
eukprot:9180128-Pyramimonas_sp.AAC.2